MESINASELQELTRLIKHGFPATKKEMPTQLEYYWDHSDELIAWDGVVLYTDRVVVPRKLRSRVIENLHSAQKATCSMNSRADTVVFWPNVALVREMQHHRLRYPLSTFRDDICRRLEARRCELPNNW